MRDYINTLHLGDCVEGINELPEGSVDLAFADPPFNIGYVYDVYDDSVEHPQYIEWSSDWISAVFRVLKPSGTFWLAIGDEYAAELKLASQRIGFHCRSWVIWYYTFGVNCAKKFTRSHAHLFHFVKHPKEFTFRDDDLDNRIPSARELVYNDKRANPRGRLPDDTWIIRPADVVGELMSDDDGTWSLTQLPPPADPDQTYTLRPQDLSACFTESEDTWYFPRVAGTFKERAGFHGCQMPEQLLGRIIRTCSHPGEIVLDPFSGSATTLAVAKKLGRQYVGFDISDDYIQYGRARLDSIRVGDRLDGSPEPLKSAPRTNAVRTKRGRTLTGEQDPRQTKLAFHDVQAMEQRYDEIQLELTLRGIVKAFRLTHEGFSADRVVADPELNRAFAAACERLGLVGDIRTWNTLLFRLRKAGKLASIDTARRTKIAWEACDNYMFASEITLQSMLDSPDSARSLDELLCDPDLGRQFDEIAERFAPGYTSLQYRWAALRLRKEAKKARSRASVLKPPTQFGAQVPLDDFDPRTVPETSGLYLLSEGDSKKLYVGEALNLRSRLALQFGNRRKALWKNEFSECLSIQILAADTTTAGKLAWQSCLIKKCKHRPRLNYFELRSAQ